MSKNVRLVNLTPHVIRLQVPNVDSLIEIPPCDKNKPARCEEVKKHEFTFYLNDEPIDVYSKEFTNVVNVPKEQEGVLYIVSRIVKNAIPDRKDIICVGDTVRDENGFIAYCINFSI
jgi:hypothetical protein